MHSMCRGRLDESPRVFVAGRIASRLASAWAIVAVFLFPEPRIKLATGVWDGRCARDNALRLATALSLPSPAFLLATSFFSIPVQTLACLSSVPASPEKVPSPGFLAPQNLCLKAAPPSLLSARNPSPLISLIATSRSSAMTVSWNNISFNSNTRAVLAATLASLGCGTLYVYSAYSTQLADRLGLSATESSVIGMCGSIGVSLLGVFAGVLVDHLGPVIPTLTGSLLLLIGYLIIFYCYYTSSRILLLLALGSCLAGFGSSMGYSSSMKTAALNFPHARGTATSFPISTFGLSAFFFSSLGAIFFSGNTSGLLLLLAFVTSSLCFFNAPFLQTPHTPHHPSAFQSYPSQVTADAGDATPTSRDGTITPVTGSNGIATYGSTAPSPRFLPSDYAGPHRDRLYSQHSLATLNEQLSALSEGSGRPNITTSASSATLVATAGAATAAAAAAAASAASPGPAAVLKGASGGNSILVGSTDIENQRQLPPIMAAHHQQHHHHHHDESHSVWGWELVKRKEFWAQFLVLGGLAGSCQMYICE